MKNEYFQEMRLLNRSVLRSLTAPLIIVILGAFVLLWQINRLIAISAWVDHTDQVMAQANEIQRDILDMEVGLRGYVISGKEEFLQPYKAGFGRVGGDISDFYKLTAENPNQLQKMRDVEGTFKRWVDFSHKVIDAKSKGSRQAQALVASGQGKDLIDLIRAKISDIDLDARVTRDMRVTKARDFAQFSFLTMGAVFILVGFWIAMAIRKQRGLQEACLISEERFRSLFELGPEGVFICDKNGKDFEANTAGCAMLGFEPEDVENKNFTDLFVEAESERLWKVRDKMIKSAEPHTGEWKMKKKDGEIIETEISMKIHSDGRWQSLVRDISMRKKYEAQRTFIAESSFLILQSVNFEKRLQLIAQSLVPEHADFCSILTFEDGNKWTSQAHAHVSPAHLNLLRHAVDEALKKGWLPVPPLGPGNSKIYDSFPWVFHEGGTGGRELEETVRALGVKSMIFVPLMIGDRCLGGLIMGMSLSKRKYSLDDLRFFQILSTRYALAIDNVKLYGHLQEAVETRERVLGIVSHDLKNPLSAIRLNSEFIKKILSGSVGSKELDLVKKLNLRIHESSSIIFKLIGSLLDISKIQAGTFTISTAEVNIPELMGQVSELNQGLAQEKGISLKLNLPPKIPFLICDGNRLTQVLLNLTGNAIKFTQPGGEVTVSVDSSETAMTFSIADNGPGIPSDQIPYVFEQFWRTKRSDQMSAGLGLSISKKIVEAHQGRIWFETREGEGTTFHFSMPIAGPENKSGFKVSRGPGMESRAGKDL